MQNNPIDATYCPCVFRGIPQSIVRSFTASGQKLQIHIIWYVSRVYIMFGTLPPNYRISAKSIIVNWDFCAIKFEISRKFQQVAHPAWLDIAFKQEGCAFACIFSGLYKKLYKTVLTMCNPISQTNGMIGSRNKRASFLRCGIHSSNHLVWLAGAAFWYISQAENILLL